MNSSIWKQDVGIAMSLDSISAAPRFAFPAGFLVRTYKPGDAYLWLHHTQRGSYIQR